MMALAVVVFNSNGSAYQALHLAGLESDLEALELIPMGSQAQLLVKGPAARLEFFLRHLSVSDVESVSFVEHWDQKIERAFYSIEHAPVRQSLVFVENAALGPLFIAASKALRSGYDIVDLKIPRGSVKWGVLILTGDASGPDSTRELKIKGNLVTRVQSPSSLLKKYFDIEA